MKNHNMTSEKPLYFTIHGHFYQPPRENPWTGIIENQESAHPFHDWNDRIAHECYSPNGASRILNAEGRIQEIVNNYEFMSFNMGATLMNWLRKKTPDTYKRIQEADKKSMERLGGHGNAIAQVYNHIIMPLASKEDRVTQIRWGIQDFEFHFNRKPEAMWLAETAINMDTVVDLICEGIRFVILSPTQAESFRDFNREEWGDVSHTNIDTTRPYRIFPKDIDGNVLCEGYLDVFFYNAELSSAVGFEHLLRDAKVFGKRIQDTYDSNKQHTQLINIGTDGESYGHHEAYGDMCAAWLFNRYAPANNMIPVNYAWFLEHFPPQHEVRLKNMHGEGSAWSCAHGVGRWIRDCGCSTGGPAEWNQKWRGPLREAFDHLKKMVDLVYLSEIPKMSEIDPWLIRNEYAQVLVEPENLTRTESFLKKVLKNPQDEKASAALIRLLEIQKFVLFSYTSCGWFFNDIEGLEPVQNMRYALRAIELFQSFLPFGHPIKEEVLSILAKATSNQNKLNGAEVFTSLATPELPVVMKMMAERAVVHHLGLNELYYDKDNRISTQNKSSRRRQTLVHSFFKDTRIQEKLSTKILVLTDHLSRVNIVVCEGCFNDLDFVENPNISTEELKSLYPSAYVVRLKNLMSDSLKRINRLTTQKKLLEITKNFSDFALKQGLTVDSLADPDHTLPDTLRKVLSMDINLRIHHGALKYLEIPSDILFYEIKDLIDESKSLKTRFSFGGTGRIFHKKIAELIDKSALDYDEVSIRHITGLISLADWMGLYIDKTSLENQAFVVYEKYKKDPQGTCKALKPMFEWLNFE
jgi:alpha-amylase/alpha-mannosidase (GH57 family)